MGKSIKTMQDLADLAGVSRGTVSRALSDSSLVNDETKRKIRDLARKHKYQLNEVARSFRLRQSRVICVAFMLDRGSNQHMSDPFFMEILGGIADSLAEADYDLLLVRAPIDNVLHLQSRRAFQHSDGVIFVGQADQHESLNSLAEGYANMVVWGAEIAEQKYCRVGADNRNGGRLITEHLLSKGRERIAFFGITQQPEIAQRRSGYIDAHESAGLSAAPELQVEVPFDVELATDTIRGFLSQRPQLDAIVCASDVIAISAISVIKSLGLRVPEDISVTGYDNIPLAQYTDPPLTTIDQNIRWAGQMLARSAISLIQGDRVPATTIKSRLVIRDSA